MPPIPRISNPTRSQAIRFAIALLWLWPMAVPGLFASPEKIYFDHLSVEHGLSQSRVLAIAQDRKGLLWFGTQDGLNRYDGYHFTVFRPDKTREGAISDHNIRTLAAASDGGLWIGTRHGGLNYYDALHRRFETHPLNAPGQGSSDDRAETALKNIGSLLEDRPDRLWVGTQGAGLWVGHRTTGFRPVTGSGERQLPANARIRALVADARGFLWIGTEKQGLYRLDIATETVTSFREGDGSIGLLSDRVLSLLLDEAGDLWIGTQAGLCRLDAAGNHLTAFGEDAEREPRLGIGQPFALLQDRGGKIWIGMRDSGLVVYDPAQRRSTHYRYRPLNDQSLNSNKIWSLFEDEGGIIWIGTGGQGLNKYARGLRQFATYANLPDHPTTPGAYQALSLAVGRDDTLWMGTWDQGLVAFDLTSDRFRYHLTGEEAPGPGPAKLVIAVLEDAERLLWLGIWGRGLVRFHPDTGAYRQFPWDPAAPEQSARWNVTALAKGTDDALWLGSYRRGLFRFDRGSEAFRRFAPDPNRADSLSHHQIAALLRDSRDRIWVGTYGGGLCRLDDPELDRFRVYRHDPDLPASLGNDRITCLWEGHRNRIWVGTSGAGLHLLREDSDDFRRITTVEGLPSDVVNGMLHDEHGFLWVATNKGLAKLDDTSGDIRVYGPLEGVQAEFNAGVFARTADGEMFFGGNRGLNRFRPDQILVNERPPPVILTGFKKFNRPVTLEREIDDLDLLELSFRDNFISFEFAALDYTAPSQNRYAYKLEGVDPEWVEAGTRNFAIYTNLSGGRYRFRVRAANSDGIWNAKGTELQVYIRPPFWQRWWFRGAMMLLGIGIVTGLPLAWQWRRLQRLQQLRREELETKRRLTEGREVERLRIAQELHDGPVQDLHAIHIQLALQIRQWSKRLEEWGLAPANQDQDRSMKGLKSLGGYILKILQDLRDLCGQLRPPTLTHFGLEAALQAHIERCREKHPEIRIECELTADQPSLSEETELALFRICQEALNNALQHARSDYVFIRFEADAENLVLEIEDNGKGFDEKQNFVQLSREGHFGLLGISERAASIGAQLSIVSRPNQGTLIRVSAPVPQSA
ncbi:HATPase-c domain-containing protein [Sulfidibacter corallicola]|uniref:Histidine kinase/HSP90-like ATPase domain-containing protein n=1 Tax=Sulfidibacter corallicola TaxID=2818388 RepID=A0A8A4TWY3_SULCO|nr:sensor histidine kinase [Sulfidibacter corallicola]QTD53990.1 hypothetical protein J3U87_16210 [Sulfidibacter corallicola]